MTGIEKIVWCLLVAVLVLALACFIVAEIQTQKELETKYEALRKKFPTGDRL